MGLVSCCLSVGHGGRAAAVFRLQRGFCCFSPFWTRTTFGMYRSALFICLSSMPVATPNSVPGARVRWYSCRYEFAQHDIRREVVFSLRLKKSLRCGVRTRRGFHCSMIRIIRLLMCTVAGTVCRLFFAPLIAKAVRDQFPQTWGSQKQAKIVSSCGCA